jgi:hypothetical protein
VISFVREPWSVIGYQTLIYQAYSARKRLWEQGQADHGTRTNFSRATANTHFKNKISNCI